MPSITEQNIATYTDRETEIVQKRKTMLPVHPLFTFDAADETRSNHLHGN